MPKPYPSEFRDDVVRVAQNREPGVTIEQAADRTSDPDEKGRLRRAASAIGDIVGQVGAGVMTAFITQQTDITP